MAIAREPTLSPRGRRGVRALLALLLVAWLAAGIAGLTVYVHRYWLYRGFPPPVTPAGVPQGTVREVHFYSQALGQERKYLIYLPPGYAAQAAAGRRFPVMYLLHAPPGRPDGFLQAGALGVDSNVLLYRHQIRPVIFVIPYGHSGTYGNDTEWANAAAGPYENFVLDVMRNVDRRFATIANRQGRGLAGLSEGGYGALNIGIHHPGEFSVLEGWSGYQRADPIRAIFGINPATLSRNSPSLTLGAAAAKLRRAHTYVWFYSGTGDHFLEQNTAFAAELHRYRIPHHYFVVHGGHNWGIWRGNASRALIAMSRRLHGA